MKVATVVVPARRISAYGILTAAACGMLSLVAPAAAQTVNIGPLSAYAPTLAAMGILPNATYLGEFAANPSGGEKQGSDFAGQSAAGVDIDLQKLIGLPGGALHIEFTDRNGRDLANDTINNSVAVQQIYGGGQNFYLTTLTYEQKLLDGLLDLMGGRTEIDQVVLHDPIYCQFQSNAFCGQPDLMGKIINASFYPVPVWGGRAIIAPKDKIFFSVGVFDSDPNDSQPGNHGFDMTFSGSQGVLVPLEADYQTSFANDAYPRRYDVGIVFDRTPYGFQTYNAATQLMGSTGAYGRTMIYVQAKQMVYRPDPAAERGLTLFGAIVLGPGTNQPANYNITAGAVDVGPFPARPKDSIGIAIGDTHYQGAFLDQLYAFRSGALGGSQRPYSSLIMGEIHYDIVLNRWLDVMPNLQYIVHPDGLGTMPYPKSNLPNAFVVGVQFKVDLMALAGLTPGN